MATPNDRSRRVDPLVSQFNDRYFHIRAISEQPRPHRKPLPYFREGGTSTVQRLGTETRLQPSWTNEMGQFSTMGVSTVIPMSVDKYYTKAHNKALAKVDDKLRVADSFFEDWYERRQAVDLLLDVGKKLLTFLVHWRKPDYWKHLAKSSRPKDLPSAWLAYQFGVKPLVGGVDRAMNLLGQEMPILKVDGVSRTQFPEEEIGNLFVTNSSFKGRNTFTMKTLVKIGCLATGANPNRALSGATGLNEPFSSAWNVIPWGWAVDYFVNVGELLGNIENKHPGVTTSDWYVTQFARCQVSSSIDSVALRKRMDNETFNLIMRNYAYTFSGKYYRMKRTTPNSVGYQLEFKFPRLGGNQAANLFSAIALTMSGKKGK